MPLYPGQILQSRYRILGPLGHGGMGAVYLAEDMRLGSRVAVKEQTPDPSASPQVLAQARQQFQFEARVLAQLNHPNLPKVTDYFSFGPNEYIVMEYVEGENLAKLMARYGRPLPEPVVLKWGNQILDALDYLHSLRPKPVIHRDIKPANVILTPQGVIKLVDFGLVKLLDPRNPGTMSGMKGIGTPQYAPLEQFAGEGHTDARSDLFSLGAMLYHLLTGTPPPDVHRRSIAPNLLAPPRRLVPALTPAVETAIMRAIELQPGRRWQTARDMRSALAGKPPPAPRPQRRASTAWLVVATVVLVLLIGIMGGMIWGQTGAGKPTATPPIVAGVTRTGTGGGAAPPATSTPAPKTPRAGLAWINTSDELFLWDPAVEESRSLSKLAFSRQWEWAPGGEHIAYQVAKGDLYLASLAKAGQRIATSADFDWSPDGRLLAYTDRSGGRCVLHLVNADGSNDRVLADLTTNPDFVGGRGGGGGAEDGVLESILWTRPFESTNDDALWWLTNGQMISVRPSEWGQEASTCKEARVSLTGQVTLCDQTTCPKNWPPTATPAPSNSSAFFQDEDDALWVFGYKGVDIDHAGADARKPDQVLNGAARSRMTNWGFHNNLWRRASNGSTQRVTNSPTFKWLGAWSSDGEWLAFMDLTVTDGAVSNDYFSGKSALNLWVAQPQRNLLLQITDRGDLEAFAWQPIPASAPTSTAGGTVRPAPNGAFDAPRLSPVVDGRFDDWSGAWQPIIAAVYGGERRTGKADLDGRARVAWDEHGLYLAVQVTDDAYRPGPSGEGLWQGDAVEIYFDRELAADFADPHANGDDFRIGLRYDAGTRALQGYRWLPAGQQGPVQITGAVNPTSSGYDLEALIPWDALGVNGGQVQAGAAFGLALAIDDNDGAKPALETLISSSPARTTADNPTQWGTLSLAE